ncbi:MAG: hypothetical protein Q9165_008663 [Trypethelium subeluteriae]
MNLNTDWNARTQHEGDGGQSNPMRNPIASAGREGWVTLQSQVRSKAIRTIPVSKAPIITSNPSLAQSGSVWNRPNAAPREPCDDKYHQTSTLRQSTFAPSTLTPQPQPSYYGKSVWDQHPASENWFHGFTSKERFEEGAIVLVPYLEPLYNQKVLPGDADRAETQIGAAYAKHRPFILLSKSAEHFKAIPLYTYQGRGIGSKSPEVQAEHVSVARPGYLCKQQGPYKPLHLEPNSFWQVKETCVAHFTEVSTFSYSCPIKGLGYVKRGSYIQLAELHLNNFHSSIAKKEIMKMDSHNDTNKFQNPTWIGKNDRNDPRTTSKILNNGSQNAPTQNLKLDMYKLNVLADLASTPPYLPAPENTDSETEADSEPETVEDLSERPAAWQMLLKAADEEYKKEFQLDRFQTESKNKQSHEGGSPNKWHKPSTLADDAALLTLKAEGISFKDMERMLPGRFSGAMQQRWYRIRHKVDRHTRRNGGLRDPVDHGTSEGVEKLRLAFMATLVYVIIFLPIGWLLYNGYCLFCNFIKVSGLGLPCIVSPVTPENPLWIAFQTAFGAALRYFPFDATSFTRHIRLGWEFHDRYQTHTRLGDAWILVTPARNWLYVADNKAIADIFSRNRDFKRPVWMLEILNVFGPSISTAEGQDWQRQRKLTATPFNEQKSPLVWNEALDQAHDMLESWLSSSDQSGGFTTTSDDTRTLALHVLAYVAFQRSYPFQSVSKTNNSSTPVKDVSSLTYRDSLFIILSNAIMVMVFPLSAFSLPFGRRWNQIGWAVHYFRSYMMKQLRDEQQLVKSGLPGTGTLVSNLVRASSEALPSESANGGSTLKPLTESEILGNIFVFNFAGHDTTAISLAYGVLLVTANPAVQDWVHEELQYYLSDDGRLSYNDVFPKLKRCLAVLYETLRLYNPLPGVPKYTGEQPAHLNVQGKTYIIPPDTLIVPNLQAAHTDPRYWGSESLTWRPQRWIAGSKPGSSKLEDEELFRPAKGTYFPWAEGTQNCPGRKFAQVEFVAVMVALLRDHVSEPVPRVGESLSDARKRTLAVVKDSNVELLLQMRNPGSIVVRWRKRRTNLP